MGKARLTQNMALGGFGSGAATACSGATRSGSCRPPSMNIFGMTTINAAGFLIIRNFIGLNI